MSQQNDQCRFGWEGWKTVTLLFIALHLFNPFQGPIQQVVSGQKEGLALAKQIGGDVQTVASVQKKIDYFGNLSEEERSKMLASVKWTTNNDYTPQGDPRAKKGGKIKINSKSFPPTIRTVGRNSHTATNSQIEGLVYEPLLNLNTFPFYYYPNLADKWYVAEDKQTFYYHIDPDARWSDGKPVRAQDVVATWDFYTDKGLEDPIIKSTWEKFDRPIALNDSVVMVKSSTKNWRTFITFSTSFSILPSHVLEKVTAKEYLKKYNKKMLPGSGPYELKEIVQPSKIIFSRRKDYWAANKKQNTGIYNFDVIENWFVDDDNLSWEQFKKGDYDYRYINTSSRWVKKCDFPKVQKGWIQKRKVFNMSPKGFQGFTFNMRKFPFNDVNIRKVFAYLWPRELFNEKLMYNEYKMMYSFFENSPNMGDNVPKVSFSPEEARKALAASGWVEKNNEGYLVKDGKTLEVTLSYVGKGWQKFFTKYQEELKKVGIKFGLKEVTWATFVKEGNERTFQLMSGAYTGSHYPNPYMSYHSKFADQKNSQNRWGYKNKEVDKIVEEFDLCFDPARRQELLKRLDDILTNDYISAFSWFAPAHRMVYWNKFGMPHHMIGKTGDYRSVVSFWWYDEDKAKALKDAIANDSSLPVGETILRPWNNK
jgi:microcin C transport system substrate-binding protein